MANPIDVEQSAPLRRRLATPNNDNIGSSKRLKYPEPPPGLPARHPLNILKRSAIIGGTMYILHGECVAIPGMRTCFDPHSFIFPIAIVITNAIIPFDANRFESIPQHLAQPIGEP